MSRVCNVDSPLLVTTYRIVELSNHTGSLASVLLTNSFGDREDDLEVDIGRRKIPPVYESVQKEYVDWTYTANVPFALGIAGPERGAESMSLAVKEVETRGRRMARRRRRNIVGRAEGVIASQQWTNRSTSKSGDSRTSLRTGV